MFTEAANWIKRSLTSKEKIGCTRRKLSVLLFYSNLFHLNFWRAGGRKSILITIADFSRRWTEFKCQDSLLSTHTFFCSSGQWGGNLSRSDGK